MKAIETVDLLVARGQHTKIPVTVPLYELPVLEEIHNATIEGGETVAMVTEIPESRRMQPVSDDFDAQTAFDQLRRKYQDKSSAPLLHRVYPSIRVFEREFSTVIQEIPDEKKRKVA